jgi:hypothetical protein
MAQKGRALPSVSPTSSSFRARVTRIVLSMTMICRRLSSKDSTDCVCCSGSGAGAPAGRVAPGDSVLAGGGELVPPMPGSGLPPAFVVVPPARETRLVCSSWCMGLAGAGAPAAARAGHPADDMRPTRCPA